ncbi:EI24 domain-containing protein [Streptomyces sp. XM83C]|uniref:EI24 domain-containing protein n=1 Tax=unclassified Streptomyces TaxID=2593676 RepID=UPI001FFA4D36|nr:EI24 domain-containing protein [Streptomyces sp. XM83C]MCK1818473.1 EI24 domain-containing protein [Streptomyces sp. XM83C]
MRDLGAGFRHLLEGQRWVARHGRQFGFGLLPGLITLVLYLAALVALAVWGGDAVAWATPFADDWGSPWQGLFRGFLTVVLFALGLLLAVVTFTAVTLLIGGPFYDTLSQEVDRDVSPDGTAPQSGLSFWRELWISARDSLRIVVRAGIWGVLLFALGFVPFAGQTVVPVIGFFVTGFFLTEELTAVALQRRGVQLRERLALLRSRKMLVWGFGTPLGLAFLVPLAAVFLMPGAVAGATLLSRELLGEETRDGDDDHEGDRYDANDTGVPTPRPQPPAGSPAPGR